jgi:hypothetical protein
MIDNLVRALQVLRKAGFLIAKVAKPSSCGGSHASKKRID